MEITRNGTQPSNKAPADHFTGAVRVDPLFQAPAPARNLAAPDRLDEVPGNDLAVVHPDENLVVAAH